MQLANAWELELAALLHGLGQISLPPEVAGRARRGAALSPAEETMVRRVPETGAGLLANIPRLEAVARMVLFQHKHFDGAGFPLDHPGGSAIPLGGRLLKILVDLARREEEGRTRREAVADLRERAGLHDPQLLDTVAAALGAGGRQPMTHVAFRDLKPGLILTADVFTKDGLLERLRNFAALAGVREPIYVEA
jgi:response regulator RpfG family c-di-GMP phosphodiesterase